MPALCSSTKGKPASKPTKSVMTVDEAVVADRKYFDEHPDEDEYIREFVPGGRGAVGDYVGLSPCSYDIARQRPALGALSQIDDDLRK
jgi:hypothetical protein